MKHPNLQELATRIHDQNKAAGWWDSPRPRAQTAWLVVTELAEATEAERDGRYADMDLFNLEYEDVRRDGSDKEESFRHAFKTHIKDTFEDEIADAVIRLLDFAASENLHDFYYHSPRDETSSNEDVFSYVCDLILDRRTLKKGYWLAGAILMAIQTLHGLCVKHGFDLWQHVELKLIYNATRPKMHGKKF